MWDKIWTTHELILMLMLGGVLGGLFGFGLGLMKGRESDHEEVWFWQAEAEKWKRAFTVVKHSSETLDAHLNEKLDRRILGRYEDKLATIAENGKNGEGIVRFARARIHHHGKWLNYDKDEA